MDEEKIFCIKCGEELSVVFQDPATNPWGYGGYYGYCENCSTATELAYSTADFALAMHNIEHAEE